MNSFWERFFYLLTYLSQGPAFLNPTSYSIMHQRHHAHSDTPKDPHSPHNSTTISQMMLKTYVEYKHILQNYQTIKDPSVTHRSPIWNSLDKFAESRLNTLLWLPVYIGLYYALNVEPIFYLLLPIHYFIGPIQGAIVNWFGHKVGYRNYDLPDKSRNTLPIDCFLMGELYQNNHHRYGQKINFASRWFEIDLTYQVSRILRFLGIIQDKGVAS